MAACCKWRLIAATPLLGDPVYWLPVETSAGLLTRRMVEESTLTGCFGMAARGDARVPTLCVFQKQEIMLTWLYYIKQPPLLLLI